MLTEHCFEKRDDVNTTCAQEGNHRNICCAAAEEEGTGERVGPTVDGEEGTGETVGPTGDGEGKEEGTGGREGPTGDGEGRMVIVNVYCPMYDSDRDEKGEGLSRLHYKMNFYRLLEARCTALEQAGK